MRRARRFRYLVPAAALVVTIAGGGLAALETDTVGSFGEGVWWALSLVTTVGFVGESPVTVGGRLLAGALMLFGVALLSLTAAALASILIREDDTPAQRRDVAFEAEVLRELRGLRERLNRLEHVAPQPSGVARDASAAQARQTEGHAVARGAAR